MARIKLNNVLKVAPAPRDESRRISNEVLFERELRLQEKLQSPDTRTQAMTDAYKGVGRKQMGEMIAAAAGKGPDSGLAKVMSNPLVYHSTGLTPAINARTMDVFDSFKNKDGNLGKNGYLLARDYMLGLDYHKADRAKGLAIRHGTSIGSMVAPAAAWRAATGQGGLMTDEDGNRDIAGIPFI